MGVLEFITDVFEEVFSWFVDIPEQDEATQGTAVNKSSNIENLPVIYGVQQVTGTRVFLHSAGPDNAYLYMIIALCEGEIEAIYNLRVDDKPIAEFPGREVGRPGAHLTRPNPNAPMAINLHHGHDTQPVDPMFAAALDVWSDQHTLSGIAYMAVRLKYYPEYFSGLPVIKATVKGRKVYHPPTGTTQWSDNHAWVLRDYLTNSRFGKGLPDSAINEALFAQAARDIDTARTLIARQTLGQPDRVVEVAGINYLVWDTRPANAFNHLHSTLTDAPDSPTTIATLREAYHNTAHWGVLGGQFVIEYELISGPDFTPASTIYADAARTRLYRCNLHLDTGKTLFNNIKTVLAGCRGLMPYTQGRYGLQIEKDAPPVFDFTPHHIIGGLHWQAPNKKDTYNRVTVRFKNPNANWQEDIAVYPPPGSATEAALLAQDNGTPLHHELTLESVNNTYQARDIARLILYKSRHNLRAHFVATSEALRCTVGDIVTVTHPSPGWQAKPFMITALGLSADGEVKVELAEHVAALYAYEAVPLERLRDDTTLPNPLAIQPPSRLRSATNYRPTQGRRGVLGIDVDWTAPDDAFVSHFEVQWQDPQQTRWHSATTTEPTYQIEPVTWLSTYRIRVRTVNGLGVRSAWVNAADHGVFLDTTAPAPPRIDSLRGWGSSLAVHWTAPADLDFSHVQVFVSVGNAIPAQPVQEAYGNETLVPALEPNTTYYLWLKAVDHLGNASAPTPAMSVNTGQTEGADGVGVESIFTGAAARTLPPRQHPDNAWGYATPGTAGGQSWHASAPNVTRARPHLLMCQRTVTGSPAVGEAVTAPWSAPVRIARFGARGADGAGMETVYTRFNDVRLPASRHPDNAWGYDAPDTAGGQVWHDAAPDLTAEEPYLFQCQRPVTGAPSTGAAIAAPWSAPRLIGRYGTDGRDGPGIEYVFRTTADHTRPATPIGGRGRDDHVPTGWFDDAQDVSAAMPYLWVSTRAAPASDGSGHAWGPWRPPTLWSRWAPPGEKGDTGEKGETGDRGSAGTDGIDGRDGINGADGQDGAGMEFIFARSHLPTVPASQHPDNAWGYDAPGTAAGLSWHDAAPDLTAEQPYLHRCERAVAGMPRVGSRRGITGRWSAPRVVGRFGEKGETGDKGDTGQKGDKGATGPKGERGRDGPGMEYVFRTTADHTRPATPIGGRDRDDHVPTGWFDNAPDVSAAMPYLWVSTRAAPASDGSGHAWGPWRPPTLWSRWAPPGPPGPPGLPGGESYPLTVYRRARSQPTLPGGAVTCKYPVK